MSDTVPFIHGVVFAANVCASTFGNDTIAVELLEEVGITSARQLEAMDIPSCDIDPLRRLFLQLRSRAGARRCAARTGRRLPQHLQKPTKPRRERI